MTGGAARRPSPRELLRRLVSYSLPPGTGWPQVLGGLLLFTFALQLVTGALLALHYSPGRAWESVQVIESDVLAGSLVRGLHHFGSSAFVLLLVAHVTRVFLYGAYKGERRWTWVSGCALLACVLAFGFTGYLLPWDLRAYFGTRVGVEIAGSVPLLGEGVRTWLAGGPEVGEGTVTRFYALHAVILPLAAAALVAAHLVLVRLAGPAPAWWKPAGRSPRFHPDQTSKELVAALVLVLVLLALAAGEGAPLGPRADPQATDYVPRPEWYFYGLQQLLRLFRGGWEPVGSFVLPAAGFAALVALPWLDARGERDPRRRPVALVAGALVLVAGGGLTLWGARELDAEEAAMARRVAAREQAAAEAQPQAPRRDPPAERRGKRLYRELACDACHGEESPQPLTPTLAHLGSKVRRPWLAAYLAEPHRIAVGTDGEPPVARMPDFLLAEEEIEDLVAYLMTRTDEELVPPRGAAAATAGAMAVEEGRLLFEDFACDACHVLDGEGDPVGPALDGVGSRLKPDYMTALLLDPESLIPGTAMTDFGMEEAEALALTRFLETLR